MQINEIYESVEGEVSGHNQGAITTFIRFQGCNLKCDYCDSKYTWKTEGPINLDVKEIVTLANIFANDNVTITGGEPLMQMVGFEKLVKELKSSGFNIAVETNGSYCPSLDTLSKVDSWIVDWKWHTIKSDIFKLLGKTDFVKFIIATEEELIKASGILQELYNSTPPHVYPSFAFSPVHGEVEPKELVDWVFHLPKKIKGGAILNLQLHKYVWGKDERRR